MGGRASDRPANRMRGDRRRRSPRGRRSGWSATPGRGPCACHRRGRRSACRRRRVRCAPRTSRREAARADGRRRCRCRASPPRRARPAPTAESARRHRRSWPRKASRAHASLDPHACGLIGQFGRCAAPRGGAIRALGRPGGAHEDDLRAHWSGLMWDAAPAATARATAPRRRRRREAGTSRRAARLPRDRCRREPAIRPRRSRAAGTRGCRDAR